MKLVGERRVMRLVCRNSILLFASKLTFTVSRNSICTKNVTKFFVSISECNRISVKAEGFTTSLVSEWFCVFGFVDEDATAEAVMFFPKTKLEGLVKT